MTAPTLPPGFQPATHNLLDPMVSTLGALMRHCGQLVDRLRAAHDELDAMRTQLQKERDVNDLLRLEIRRVRDEQQ